MPRLCPVRTRLPRPPPRPVFDLHRPDLTRTPPSLGSSDALSQVKSPRCASAACTRVCSRVRGGITFDKIAHRVILGRS